MLLIGIYTVASYLRLPNEQTRGAADITPGSCSCLLSVQVQLEPIINSSFPASQGGAIIFTHSTSKADPNLVLCRHASVPLRKLKLVETINAQKLPVIMLLVKQNPISL